MPLSRSVAVMVLFVLAEAFRTFTASAADATIASTSINQFGLELHRNLALDDANFCIAPYSIQCAMAMLYAGADGETHTEMANVLHLPAEDSAVQESFAALAHGIGDSIKEATAFAKANPRLGAPAQPIAFSIESRVFAQQGYVFESAYLDLLEGFYHAPLRRVDFKGNPAAAAVEINAWLEKPVQREIHSAIPRGAIDPQTRLVLSNRFYFKAAWENAFDPRYVKPKLFHIKGGEAKYAQTMKTRAPLRCKSEPGFTAIAFPYASREFHLLVLLPESANGLHEIEQKLSGEKLTSFAKMSGDWTTAYLPKFRINSRLISLTETLKTLGLKTAFDDPKGSANFTRIAARTPADYLGLTNVFHQTALAVDEDGVEASAEMVLQQGTLGGGPAEVTIDRPFFFAVQHIPSGACLLMGHVVDPREEPGDPR